MSASSDSRINLGDLAHLPTILAEPFAFALLTWPAAAAAVHWDSPEGLWWRIAACAWLLAFHATAYRRGSGFGNVMVLLSGVVAWAWWMFPSPWAFGALPLLLIGLHGAQRALLKRQPAGCDALPADGAGSTQAG